MAPFSKLLTRSGDEAGVLSRMVRENFSAYRRDYIIAIIALMIIAGTTAFSAWLMGPVVEKVFLGGDLDAAYMLAGVVVGVFLLKGAMTYVQSVTLNRIGNNMVARFQRRVFAHLLSLGVGFFAGQHSASLVARLNQNIAAVRDMLNVIVLAGARDLLSLIGLIGVMVWSDPLMSAIVFIAGPIALVTLGKYARRVKTIARDEVDLNSQVTTRIQETAHGIQIVKAFTMEDQMRARLDALTEEVEGRANKIARLIARSAPLMETLAGLSVAGVIAYGGWRVVNEGYSAGSLAAFMTALLMAYEPAKRLAKLKVTIEKSLVNARMLYEVLDTPTVQADGGATATGPDLTLDGGTVSFENVSFDYGDADTSQPVLARHEFRRPKRARRRRWSVRPAAASPPRWRCFSGSTSRMTGASPSTGRISPPSRSPRSARPSPSCRNSRSCFRARCGTICATPAPTRRMSKSRPPPAPRRPTISSPPCRRATTRRWARTARTCPAASASACPSPAPSCATRPFWCWTKRPRRSTTSPNPSCSRLSTR